MRLFFILSLFSLSAIVTAQNVGIGNATPTFKLDVLTNTTDDGIRIFNQNRMRLLFQEGGTGSAWGDIRFDPADESLRLYSNGGPVQFFSNASEAMRIHNNQDVSIGTTQTPSQLTVGLSTTGDGITLLGGSNNITHLRFATTPTATDALLEYDDLTNELRMYSQLGDLVFESGSNELMRGMSTGYLGIGSSAATRYLMPNARGTNNQILQTDGSGNVTWVDFDDADWIVSGSDMYSAVGGYVGIGTAAPNALLDISNNTIGHGIRVNNLATANSPVSLHLNNQSGNSWQYGLENTVGGVGTSTKRGIQNTVNLNASTNVASYGINTVLNTNGSAATHFGLSNTLNLGASSATSYGLDNRVNLNGTTNTQYGIRSQIIGNATSGTSLYGFYSSLSSNDGTIYGLYAGVTNSGTAAANGVTTFVSNTGTSIGRGTYNFLQASTTGSIYGTSNFLQGASTGSQYGTYNNLLGSGSGAKYAVYNRFQGVASGANYGVYNVMGGNSGSSHWGVSTVMTGNGNGNKYGISNVISAAATGTGQKFGTYNHINAAAGGTHYGVYSSAVKAGSYAGYFLGDVTIGTTSGNVYTLPPSRGTNNQVMVTDGVGNVTWQTLSSGDNDWTVSGNNQYSAVSGTVGIGYTSTGAKLGVASSSYPTMVYLNQTYAGANAWSYGLHVNYSGSNTNSKIVVNASGSNASSGNIYGLYSGVNGGPSTGTAYGTTNYVTGTGSGNKYGTSNLFASTAGGNKFGTFTSISASTPGTHYGLYSTVLKAGSHAGYFLGNVTIGTTSGNVYTLPPSRGTNNQVMVTDGVGNVTWQTLTTGDADWTISGVNQYSAVTGNVGIGVSSPSVKLDVNSSSGHTARFDGGNSMYMSIYEAGNYRGYWGSYSGAAQDVDFGTGGGNSTGKVHLTLQASPAVTIAPGTFVGIGTTTPSYRLHVNTNSAAKPTSSAWTIPSDLRLKTNVHKYEDGLSTIKSINPVWFTYTGEADMPQETGVGIIAQELREVAPYMVGSWEYEDAERGKTEYLDVDNGPMVYMLINAVKELSETVEVLQAELEALRAAR